jgi:membrane fusion protein (multidrug efflux system)
MNRRIVAVAVAVAVVAVAAGLWWFLVRSTGGDSAQSTPTARVALAPVQVGAIAQTLEAFGVVEPAPGSEQVSSAPYDCLVGAIYVAAGAEVAAGDVLLQIAPSPDSQLLFDAARSALVVAGKALSATQERFDLKLATSQDLVVARQGEADAKARVASLAARGLGGDGKIRARTAGVVSKLDVTRGAAVALGAPLASVATTHGLEARIALEGSSRSILARDQLVTLTSTDNPDPLPVESRVRTVGAALNVAAGSLDVRVPVPASAPLLLGEHVRALIEVKKHAAALIVPRSSVLPDQGAQVLFTVSAGKAARHEVTLGIASGDQLEVQGAGLKAGDAIVVTGNYELSDGMAVQAETVADKSADDAAAAASATPGAGKAP